MVEDEDRENVDLLISGISVGLIGRFEMEMPCKISVFLVTSTVSTVESAVLKETALHSTARLHQQMKKPIADILFFRRLLHPLAKCCLLSDFLLTAPVLCC
ncbi:unnamed protein product [Sphenostylis stenocarpa]|uniref:Uncharacterized protein n=1 Tax=Sphenostylis stenocarpa TaxID=92480 RepID=A0AA86T8V8_9FABA|nr:unnamed protein product [Sphenostylis stenocarpa]